MDYKKLSIILLLLFIGMIEGFLYFKPSGFEWFVTIFLMFSVTCSFIWGGALMSEDIEVKPKKDYIIKPKLPYE
jgi:hypothetical protein